MPCRTIDLGNGVTGVVCSRGRRPKPCSVTGCTRPHTALCDWKLTGPKAGKTCDRALCDGHRVSHGNDVDYCPAHDALARAEPVQLTLERETLRTFTAGDGPDEVTR